MFMLVRALVKIDLVTLDSWYLVSSNYSILPHYPKIKHELVDSSYKLVETNSWPNYHFVHPEPNI